MIENITIDNFQPYLNQPFTIKFSLDFIEQALLKRITPWGSLMDGAKQPFTLEFETGLKEQYFLQGTFILIHPVLGDLVLFMVPIGVGDNGMCYEVVFS